MNKLANWWRKRGSKRTTIPVKARNTEPREFQEFLNELRSLRPQDLLPVRLSDRPQWTSWSTSSAIKDGMKASTWVYTCIMKTAVAISSIPWQVVRVASNGTEEPDDDNGLALLLREPNIAWGWRTCTQLMVMHLLLSGNAIVTKNRAFGVPGELWPHNPAHVKPIPSTAEFIKSYQFSIPGTHEKKLVSPKDIIHVMLPDPENPRWGMSPMQAASRAIDVDRESAAWQKTSLQNLMVPPVVFTFEKHVTKAQVEAAKKLLKEQYAGAKNAREALFLGSGPTPHKLALSPEEMDFIKSREMNAEEICATFDVPPPIVGLLRMAKYSNMKTAERLWYESRLLPFAEGIIEAFNRQLAPEFASEGAGSLALRLDTSNVAALLTRFAERVSIAKELWSMGYPASVVNQRMHLGMPRVAGDDIAYVPSGMNPISEAQAEALRARLKLIDGGK